MKRFLLNFCLAATMCCSSHGMQTLKALNTRVGPEKTSQVFSQVVASMGMIVFSVIAAAITQSSALDSYITHQTCAPVSPSECQTLLPALHTILSRLNASELTALNTMFNHTNARPLNSYVSTVEGLCSKSSLPSWCYELDATLKWRLTFWTPMAASVVGWIAFFGVGKIVFKCAILTRLSARYGVLNEVTH